MLLGILLGIVLAFAWIGLLFYIGQSEKRSILFYILLYLPYLAVIAIFAIFPEAFIDVVTKFNAFLWIMVIFFVMERIAWGLTLNENSGNDEVITFYLVYLFGFIGWWIYRLTQLNKKKNRMKADNWIYVAFGIVYMAIGIISAVIFNV